MFTIITITIMIITMQESGRNTIDRVEPAILDLINNTSHQRLRAKVQDVTEEPGDVPVVTEAHRPKAQAIGTSHPETQWNYQRNPGYRRDAPTLIRRALSLSFAYSPYAEVKPDQPTTSAKHPLDEEDNYDRIIKKRAFSNPDISRSDKQGMEIPQYTQTPLKANYSKARIRRILTPTSDERSDITSDYDQINKRRTLSNPETSDKNGNTHASHYTVHTGTRLQTVTQNHYSRRRSLQRIH